MVRLHQPTLDALHARLQALLGGPTPLFLDMIRFQPIGLSGYLGHSREVGKQGDIYGLRLEAQVLFPVNGTDAAVRNTAAATIDTALLGKDRTTLRKAGFYKLEPVGRKEESTHLELTYQLVFEFIQVPENDSALIGELVVASATGSRESGDQRPLRDILDELPHQESFNIKPN